MNRQLKGTVELLRSRQAQENQEKRKQKNRYNCLSVESSGKAKSPNKTKGLQEGLAGRGERSAGAPFSQACCSSKKKMYLH